MELQTLTKHVLYIGLNDKDSKVQEITTDRAKEIISETFGDCTISDAFRSLHSWGRYKSKRKIFKGWASVQSR